MAFFLEQSGFINYHMSAQILEFKLKEMPSRTQALQWLFINKVVFPADTPHEIGPILFHGWRFVRSTDGILYFANFIHQGITEGDLYQHALANR